MLIAIGHPASTLHVVYYKHSPILPCGKQAFLKGNQAFNLKNLANITPENLQNPHIKLQINEVGLKKVITPKLYISCSGSESVFLHTGIPTDLYG